MVRDVCRPALRIDAPAAVIMPGHCQAQRASLSQPCHPCRRWQASRGWCGTLRMDEVGDNRGRGSWGQDGAPLGHIRTGCTVTIRLEIALLRAAQGRGFAHEGLRNTLEEQDKG